jgi:predicted ATPase
MFSLKEILSSIFIVDFWRGMKKIFNRIMKKIKSNLRKNESIEQQVSGDCINNEAQTIPMMETIEENQLSQAKRPEYYVNELNLGKSFKIGINSNDIVVLVGANNVGKSQCLNDIYELIAGHSNVIVCKNLSINKYDKNQFLLWCYKHLKVKNHADGQDKEYVGMGMSYTTDYYLGKENPATLRDIFVCKLETFDRLQITTLQNAIEPKDIPRHPIHILIKDNGLMSKISSYFSKAFGCSLFPSLNFRSTIPICVGTEPAISDIKAESLLEFQVKYDELMESFPKLHDQGDGMRSFVGLMLYLIIDRFNLFLIDEPEAFLHPPQATILGDMVGDLLGDERQAVIATHSINFIKGLLEKCPNRVKIVRITRSSSSNLFSVLNNDKLLEISKDPFLKHSLLLNGLFYKNVVLCEGDVDCMFYSMLNSSNDMKGAKGADTLFIHSGGKQRMDKVLWSLKELNVEVKVVTDFDILNDKDIFRKLVESCGGTWDRVENNYKTLDKYRKEQSTQCPKGKDILQIVQSELKGIEDTEVSPDNIKTIKKLIRVKTVWDELKNKGLNGIESQSALMACEAIFEYLKTIGLHVVPCGELEQFIPEVEGHGTSWLNTVQENYPDVSDGIYDRAKDFIRSLNL